MLSTRYKHQGAAVVCRSSSDDAAVLSVSRVSIIVIRRLFIEHFLQPIIFLGFATCWPYFLGEVRHHCWKWKLVEAETIETETGRNDSNDLQ